MNRSDAGGEFCSRGTVWKPPKSLARFLDVCLRLSSVVVIEVIINVPRSMDQFFGIGTIDAG